MAKQVRFEICRFHDFWIFVKNTQFSKCHKSQSTQLIFKFKDAADSQDPNSQFEPLKARKGPLVRAQQGTVDHGGWGNPPLLYEPKPNRADLTWTNLDPIFGPNSSMDLNDHLAKKSTKISKHASSNSKNTVACSAMTAPPNLDFDLQCGVQLHISPKDGVQIRRHEPGTI